MGQYQAPNRTSLTALGVVGLLVAAEVETCFAQSRSDTTGKIPNVTQSSSSGVAVEAGGNLNYDYSRMPLSDEGTRLLLGFPAKFKIVGGDLLRRIQIATCATLLGLPIKQVADGADLQARALFDPEIHNAARVRLGLQGQKVGTPIETFCAAYGIKPDSKGRYIVSDIEAVVDSLYPPRP